MLELQTFGGLELRAEAGEGVEGLTGRTKCLAVLAYLAVEAPDGRVPREQVAALLWPGGTDERARASLRAALSQIRQATGPVLVAGEGTSRVGLVRDHVRADVTAFQEALAEGEEARALEIYGGDFLAGVRVQGTDRFQRWADRQRGRCRQQAYEAALSVGAAARATDDLAAAEAAYRRALSLAPLREEAAEKLLRTLADRGRAADAVQLYEAFRKRRREELEMAPSEELEAWVEGLKQAPPAAFGATEEGEPAEEGAGPEMGGSSAEALEVRPSPDTDVPVGATVSRWGRFRRRTLLGALVTVGLVSAALAGAWHLVGPGGEAAAVAAGDRSVAVLPFEALGEEGADLFARGMHGDLLTRLSHVADLEVISATSVERYRQADRPLPAIADELGVRWVVEGGVQQTGGAIQVHAQLIDPRTDTHAWAETYRRELTAEGLFDLQADITRQVVRALEAELGPGEAEQVERRPTLDLQAYRLYVQGRRRLDTRTEAGIREALEHFRRAIKRDSSYALAWAGLADAVGMFEHVSYASSEAPLPDHEETARRALELGPDLAEAHASMGYIYRERQEGPAALRVLQRAVEIQPSYAQAHHWLGWLQLSLGRLEEAEDHLSLAVELNPHHAGARGVLAWAYVAQGKLDSAESLASDLPVLAGQRAAIRALVLYHGARWDELEALALEQRRLRREDSPVPAHVWPFYLARIEVLRDDTGSAERYLAEMRRADDRRAQDLFEGLVHAALGDPDAAFAAWNEIEEWQDSILTHSIRYWFPDILDPLRDDPRYRELIEKINRQWGMNPDGSLPEETRGSLGATDTPS